VRPPGRVAAAMEVLGEIAARHRPVSEALRDWGLSHRFAGSGDRAAIGNLAYDALRKRASIAWRMGGDSPWHLAVGAALMEVGATPEALNEAFAGDAHAPDLIPPDLAETLATRDLATAPAHVRADIPEWLAPRFEAVLGETWAEEGAALATRPPLDLRVNTLKADREKAAGQLSRLGAVPTPHSPVGLRIPPVAGGRRHPNIQTEEAFQRGRIEVQDEGSQLCALLVGAKPGEQILDFCAGAGGKTLALCASMENRGQIFAYDSDRNRLAPIYERLKRAGARNVQVRPADSSLDDLEARMDRVLVDAPCTGTGVWRRRPDAKWRLTEEALARRIAEQDAVLAQAARFVRPGGVLVYATCSLLRDENQARIESFLAAHPDFSIADFNAAVIGLPPHDLPGSIPEMGELFTPLRTATDGFFVVSLRRADGG
jgi:16S rRNA (cytosine967-C5)-methyltransferase